MFVLKNGMEWKANGIETELHFLLESFQNGLMNITDYYQFVFDYMNIFFPE